MSNNNSNKLPVIDTDAGGKGNCFYFSLYEALKERDLIKNLEETYSIGRYVSKETFNKYFRMLISSQLSTDIMRETFIVLKEVFDNNSDLSIAEISHRTELQSWLIKDFINSNSSLMSFTNLVKKSIMIRGREVQSLEVNLAIKLLALAGISLVIIKKIVPTRKKSQRELKISGLSLNTNERKMLANYDNQPTYNINEREIQMPFNLPIENGGQPIIYLISSPIEGHYTYFSFSLAKYEGGLKKKKTKKRIQRKPITKKRKRFISSRR